MNRQTAWLDLLIDTLIASALAAGLAEAVFQYRGLSGHIGLTILAALAGSALFALLSRRWWLAPYMIGLPLLIALLVLWRTRVLLQIWPVIAEYAGWARLWLVSGQPPPPAESWLTLLKAGLILLLSGLCLLLVRKITWLSLYAGIIFLVFMPLLIIYPAALPALLLALAGLVLMLPRQFLAQIRRERPRDTVLPRAPLQVLAIPATVIALLLAQAIVPASTAGWRLPALVNQINDFTDLWQNGAGKGRIHNPFNIADLGFQPAGERLGGPVIQSDKVVLKVSSDQPVLLKGSTHSIYTGSSWQSPFRPSYRLDSDLWWQIRRTVYDRGLPSGTAGKTFLASFSRSLQLVIRPQTTHQTTLFAAGRVLSVETEDKETRPPYFTNDGSLFVWQELPDRSVYTVESDYLDRSKPGFDLAVLNLEKAASGSDPNWAAVRREYLQLPSGLPPEVSQAARDAVGQAGSPYQKAVILEKYLQTGFTYSLSPGFVPADSDFVAYFLQSKTGYCVYFATAMAVMARTLDIPSRYVEGFALGSDSSSQTGDSWAATGETAHSWVELYFKGIGWLTFDPTPGAYTNPDGGNPQPSVTPGASPSPPTVTPSPTPGAPGPPPHGSPSAWIWLLPVLLLAGAVRLVHVRIRHTRRFSRLAVGKRWPDFAGQLEFYYDDIMRQLTCLNIYPEPGETLALFAERAERHLRLEGLPVPEILWPVSRWLYGALPPSPEEVSRLADLHDRLERRLRDSLSGPAYFIKRILSPDKRIRQAE